MDFICFVGGFTIIFFLFVFGEAKAARDETNNRIFEDAYIKEHGHHPPL